MDTRKVLLFSPNGYAGGFIKERLAGEKGIQLYEMTREGILNPSQTDYDVLVYSAAVTSARHETARKYVQDNVVTAVSMIDLCKKYGVERIIYLSSDEIYGELNTDKILEQTVMVNPNVYAATKYLAEKIIMESGIPYFILRLPGIVGRIWGRNFIYSMMERISCNAQVDLYNPDKKFNNILHIDDLTEFITVLCNIRVKASEILLLGNTECVRLSDMVTHMKELYHSSSIINHMAAEGRRYFTLDVAKAVEYGYHSKKIMAIIDDLYQIRERQE